MLAETHQLAVSQKLPETKPIEEFGKLAPRLRQGGRVVMQERGGPLVEFPIAVRNPQRTEEGVIVEPGGLGLAKLLERCLHVRPRSAAKTRLGQLEQPMLQRDYGRIIDAAGRRLRRGQVGLLQQSVFHEPVGAKKQLVEGECREGLVGRVPAAGRA